MLESQWTPDLSLDDALELARAAVEAGITNDLGSGSCIDICVMDTAGGLTYRRGYSKEEAGPSFSGPLQSVAQGKKSMHTTCDQQQLSF